MKTEVLTVHPLFPEPAAIAQAAEVLRRGGLVVLPTETVYGLAARADDPQAVARIFEAKGRPAYNPLIVHVADIDDARALANLWPDSAERLAAAFWPGPLTLVVERNPRRIPDIITAGGPTVGIRIPAHAVARTLLRALGRPFAAPSANRFQGLSPTTAAHAMKSLDGRVDLVLDGGTCEHGIESTVVDCTGIIPTVLRHGATPLAELRRICGEVHSDQARSGSEHAALRSPGMLQKHYAPSARLVVVPAHALAATLLELGEQTALISHSTAASEALRRPSPGSCRAVKHCILPADPEGYAAALYTTLHGLDDAGYRSIVVEAVPDDEAWSAVQDRLSRAQS